MRVAAGGFAPLYGRFERLATAPLGAGQRIRSAAAMPQARPLKPTTHWRSRSAMFIAEGLRQGHVAGAISG